MRRGSGGDRLPPWWVEVVVLLAAYAAYQLVQVLVTGSAGAAIERARALWAVEDRLHLAPELTLNGLVAGSHLLVVTAGIYYTTLHFVLTPAVLVWLRVRRPGLYASLRNTLVGASLVALVVFWLLPLAPPRLSIAQIVDTGRVNQMVTAGPSWPASLANEYAAMPSLHMAWAVWVAVALGAGLGGAWRYLAWAYPLATALVVIGTGNHFLADVVAGTALVLGVRLLIVLRARRRRGVGSGPGGPVDRSGPVDRGGTPSADLPGAVDLQGVLDLPGAVDLEGVLDLRSTVGARGTETSRGRGTVGTSGRPVGDGSWVR